MEVLSPAKILHKWCYLRPSLMTLCGYRPLWFLHTIFFFTALASFKFLKASCKTQVLAWKSWNVAGIEKKTKKSSLSKGQAALTFCGSLYISGKLPTYPSPKPTLTLTSHLKENVGGGVGGQFLRNVLWSHFACPLPLLACHSKWFSYKITCLGPCPLGNLGKKVVLGDQINIFSSPGTSIHFWN